MVIAQRITRGAVLTALALALSYVERMSPLPFLIPIPGLRLGFANIVTVYALCRIGGRDAFAILTLRCFIGALFGGSLTSLWFSLSGGICSFITMRPLFRCKALSLYGICIAGSAAHQVGQILAAAVLFSSAFPLFYLPPLLMFSIVTGILIARISDVLIRRIPFGSLLR